MSCHSPSSVDDGEYRCSTERLSLEMKSTMKMKSCHIADCRETLRLYIRFTNDDINVLIEGVKNFKM